MRTKEIEKRSRQAKFLRSKKKMAEGQRRPLSIIIYQLRNKNGDLTRASA